LWSALISGRTEAARWRDDLLVSGANLVVFMETMA
jgi:hypothetical protein